MQRYSRKRIYSIVNNHLFRESHITVNHNRQISQQPQIPTFVLLVLRIVALLAHFVLGIFASSLTFYLIPARDE